jgi:hypothetical protein
MGCCQIERAMRGRILDIKELLPAEAGFIAPGVNITEE